MCYFGYVAFVRLLIAGLPRISNLLGLRNTAKKGSVFTPLVITVLVVSSFLALLLLVLIIAVIMYNSACCEHCHNSGCKPWMCPKCCKCNQEPPVEIMTYEQCMINREMDAAEAGLMEEPPVREIPTQVSPIQIA